CCFPPSRSPRQSSIDLCALLSLDLSRAALVLFPALLAALAKIAKLRHGALQLPAHFPCLPAPQSATDKAGEGHAAALSLGSVQRTPCRSPYSWMTVMRSAICATVRRDERKPSGKGPELSSPSQNCT